MSYLLITVSVAAVLLISNCGKPKATVSDEKERIFPVQVTKVKRANIERNIAYLGNLEAYQEVRVFSTIPTRMTELKVDVNDFVNEGDLLAVVDNIKIKQAVIQAEEGLKSTQAQYENALAEWKRIKKLYDQNAVSQSQYDAVRTQKEAARAAVNQLKAGLKSAKEQLNDSFIKAPISGIISTRTYNVGDQTSPQFPAFTIVQMDKIKINIDIVESQIALIIPNQRVNITVNTYPGDVFTGIVNKIYPTINPMTRTVKCEIIIDNPDYRLKPGGFARVEIVTDEHENVLVVPKYAIIEKTSLEYLGGEITNTRINTKNYVFIVKNSVALMQQIETDIVNNNYAEVISGLNGGEDIITIGQYNISDSSMVEIIEEGE
ncbi:MAG: efflux RND transporter periplasmic adaptor subunit [Candidatus Marinimicrobia bacterium]|nr:efflux RND transporter periplasmic adaptor subunit [bacterium]MCG2714943.1 efflux RND transporter periplasmic adaptor subunit [Candidatus Neomarinimicrobiota bacterium]